MLKAYKYRIYPTEEQKILIEKHFGCCRLMIINQINFKTMTNSNYTTKARLAKSCLIFLLSVVFLCGGCTSGNENDTIKWINEHEKPIRCKYTGQDLMGHNVYTLIDKDGNIYNTGRIEMALPDTISVWGEKNY